MKFLFVSDFLPERNSGAAGSIFAIGEALADLGHEVVYDWHVERRLSHATASRLLELPRLQLRQVAARLSATPFDVVVVSQPFAFPVFERLPRRHPATLFLNRTHGWETRLLEAERRFAWEPTAGAARRALRALSAAFTARACRRTARAAHGVLAASSRCAEFIQATYATPAGRVNAIPYGLDPAYQHAPTRSAADVPAAPRFLFVGSWIARKGARLLEELLPALPRGSVPWTLTCVVEARAVEEVRARLASLGPERLDVRPWMTRERLREVYSSHDVFLYPSLFEGFGKTWLEAMACGLCVVGFDEGGLGDVARSGVDALYGRTGDVEALRADLSRLIASPSLAAEVGARGQATARTYTWARTARETVECCERLSRARRS
jgi:glycosyltransferase involved in cell wall biosynthesis